MMRYWTHSYRAHTLRQATTKAHTIREEAAPLPWGYVSQTLGAHPLAGYHEGAHNPRGGCSILWGTTRLTVTGRSPSGRLPLRRTQSLRRLLLTVSLYYNPWTQGAHLSGRLPLRRTQSMRGQLLSVARGSTLGSGLLCESVETSSYLHTDNKPKTTSPSPQRFI